jgi:spermidine dehydrogenase
MDQKHSEDQRLGMFRAITRRDFLQGTALALAAPRLARGAQRTATALPPSGLDGQDIDSMEWGHRVRDGVYRELPADASDTGEAYDLVVVGSGLAGLAAAYLYRRERGEKARILLLENNEHFGGHATRNTFHWDDKTFIVFGGTYDLESPETSPPEAEEIFKELGVDPDRLLTYRDPDFRTRFGLSSTAFFDPKVYPGIKPQFVRGFHDIPWEKFFAGTPLSDEAKRELVELYTTRKNYLAGIDEPYEALAGMTWESYIRDKMGLGDEAVRFSNLYATDLGGLGCDALPATYGYELGPGFIGVGGEGFYEEGGMQHYGYSPIYRYPDGNHSVARHLLKKILPETLDGPDTMEGVFNATIHPERFDSPDGNVRLRLRSTVVRVQSIEGGSRVLIHYATPDGSVHSVTSGSAIVTAWGAAAKHIVPEISSEQRKALDGYNYGSSVYINVLLRQWRPIADIGAFEMYLPGGYCTWMHVSDPLRVGEYRPEYHPDKPTVLSMFRYPTNPGFPPGDQMKLGRFELEAKSFEEFEREIRTYLDHVLGPWGFDPANDILAITVNRWGHGYVIFPYPSVDKPIYTTGREQLGRISFAGADAGGTPWTQAAFRESRRAVYEQLEFD